VGIDALSKNKLRLGIEERTYQRQTRKSILFGGGEGKDILDATAGR